MNELLSITLENYLQHLAQILAIERKSFPTPWSEKGFVEEIKNPVSYLTAFVEDQRLWGYICFWLFSTEIQVINIAVHPAKRNRGIGFMLLSNMIERGTKQGMRDIWLEVRESNRAAKKLYERLGFEAIGRRKGYYSDTKEDAVVMSLRLPNKEQLSAGSF